MLGICACTAVASGAFRAQDYKPNLSADHPAIQYARASGNDAVSTFARAIEGGILAMPASADLRAHLPTVLEHLRVSPDSQMLVFSKTSFQSPKISPDNPRAIYFNDEVAVGYVPGGPTLELSAIDPLQGPVFYTFLVNTSGKPAIARSDVCVRCHQGPNTAGVPGIYVGSVIPGPSGAPLRDESAIITDHRSDFAERWGGWYVTARRGEQLDRANAVASSPADPETLVRESRQNLTSLVGLVDVARHLTSTSDIVALMTFEHQTQMTNLITRVGWQARIAEHAGPDDRRAQAALDADIEDLVAYMLFSGEAPLKEPIEGVSSFTRTFPQRGPRDRQGRSLRDFDLQTRLFRYPLSYMIYSAAFEGLPAVARERIERRLNAILSGKDRDSRFGHLSTDDRRAIAEILRDTRKRPTSKQPTPKEPGWRDHVLLGSWKLEFGS